MRVENPDGSIRTDAGDWFSRAEVAAARAWLRDPGHQWSRAEPLVEPWLKMNGLALRRALHAYSLASFLDAEAPATEHRIAALLLDLIRMQHATVPNAWHKAMLHRAEQLVRDTAGSNG